MRTSIALISLLVAVSAGQSRWQQVPTTVEEFPSVVALLRTVNFATYLTACGGSILNNRAVLTAARCFEDDGPERWRFRVGSTTWNSGGDVYQATSIILHEDWDEWAMLTDIAIVRTAGGITLGTNVVAGSFASYAVPANQPVTTIGWGYVRFPLWVPTLYENLRKVELTNFDIDVCRPVYSTNGFPLRNTQLCTGFSDPEEGTRSRNKCFGEPGTPVFHGRNIVGIRSYSLDCYDITINSISTHVGSFIDWIQENA